mgnify:CR=1 FL=1
MPVVGVLPMLHVDIEDEDSLSERLTTHTEVQAVDIAVIRIPRMSNYTDFNVFELIPGVSLRYVRISFRVEKSGYDCYSGNKKYYW